MKKQSLKIFLISGLFAILAHSINAQAQNTVHEQTANIPFSFTVRDKSFEAGSYTISRVNPSIDPSALLIKSQDGRVRKIVLTTSVRSGVKAQENSRLVFNRYGDLYFLAQVWTQSDITGLEIPRSRSERTLLARSPTGRTADQVAIALGARRR